MTPPWGFLGSCWDLQQKHSCRQGSGERRLGTTQEPSRVSQTPSCDRDSANHGTLKRPLLSTRLRSQSTQIKADPRFPSVFPSGTGTTTLPTSLLAQGGCDWRTDAQLFHSRRAWERSPQPHHDDDDDEGSSTSSSSCVNTSISSPESHAWPHHLTLSPHRKHARTHARAAPCHISSGWSVRENVPSPFVVPFKGLKVCRVRVAAHSPTPSFSSSVGVHMTSTQEHPERPTPPPLSGGAGAVLAGSREPSGAEGAWLGDALSTASPLARTRCRLAAASRRCGETRPRFGVRSGREEGRGGSCVTSR